MSWGERNEYWCFLHVEKKKKKKKKKQKKKKGAPFVVKSGTPDFLLMDNEVLIFLIIPSVISSVIFNLKF